MITFNEEHHIGQAIDNIKDFADEIYVLDSLSTDRTVDIALEKGAIVLQRPFTNFGDQWNFALQHFPIQSTWTIKMDPDERISEELKNNIRAILTNTEVNGIAFYRRLWLMGKPLRSKQKVLRGWRTGACHFAPIPVNEYPIVDGEVVLVSGEMQHLDSPTLFDWQAKQNRYSTMEAIELYKRRYNSVGRYYNFKEWMKFNIYRIPGCFVFLYWYHFLIKLAFLDGRVGWAWARLRTEVYRMRWYKYIEFCNQGRYTCPPKSKIGRYHPQVSETQLQQKIMMILQ